jgi:phage tail sheath protein FI
MPTYATPGVYFERVDNASQAIPEIRTDIAGFVGIAQRGPVHKATAVESWQQFQSTFGSFIPNAYLAYSAKAFFENGGERMYVVRVAAPNVKTTTSSPGLQPLDGLSSALLSSSGFVAGALTTLEQTASTFAVGAQPADRLSSLVNSVAGFTPGSVVRVAQVSPPFHAWHTVQSVDPVAKRIYWGTGLEPTFALVPPLAFSTFHHEDRLVQSVSAATNTVTWAESIVPDFDVTQAIQVETGRSSSRGRFYDADRVVTIEVKAANPGSWGDAIQLAVSHSSLAATATSTVPQPPSGEFSYVQSVVGFPLCSLVRVYQSNSPFPNIAYRTVTLVDPVINMLRWDAPLLSPFDVTKPISFETVEFSLTVYVNGSLKESFTGLSMNPGHSRYVESVVNWQVTTGAKQKQVGLPSQYVRVRDLHSTSAAPDNLPDPSAPQLDRGILDLWGGRDGIAALTMKDFTGDPARDKKWGIRAMEDVDEISIVAVPDILIEPVPPIVHAPVVRQPPDPCLPCGAAPGVAPPPTLPPSEAAPNFTLNQIHQVQQALIQHCQMMQFRFAILDPPDFGFPKLHVDLGEVQSWRQRFDTMYAALYYPWILVRDPLQLGNSLVRRVPPSGHVAGVYANSDLIVGVHKAPANAVVQWAQALTTEVTAEMQGFLNPIDVDCLRTFSGRGMRVYGARTLSSDTIWQFINVRRLFFMIEHALLIGMQWVVFEPNNVHLWHLLTVNISSFLEGEWKKGALAGNTAEESFFVKCDATNNPQATTALGELIVEIGVAPTLPAEFVIFRIGRVGDSLEVTE